MKTASLHRSAIPRLLNALAISPAAVLVATLVMAATAHAATTWVVTSTGDDVNDTTTLRGALHAAGNGDSIDLTGLTGTIMLTNGSTAIDRELSVVASVTITGPGASSLAIDGNNFSRVFHIYTGATVTISGLTIQHGDASGDTALASYGGGIRNAGTLTLNDCTLSSNAASQLGGAVYNLGNQNLNLHRCTVTNNSAVAEGGGLYNDQGTASISDTTFSGNSANNGGAMSDYLGTTSVSNSTFASNSAMGVGGAIDSDSTLSITGSRFFNNQAGTPDALGIGGALAVSGTVTISESTFDGNTIPSGAGGQQAGSALTNYGHTTVIGSTFSHNSGNIAAVLNDNSLVLTNSTLSGNATAVANHGSLRFENCTIAGNTGGALQVGGFWNSPIGTLALKNTILANAPAGNCFSNGGTLTSEDHNISDDATCASYLTQPHDLPPSTPAGLDPAGVKDHGGPTQTIALLPGSPALDAINPASDCPLATDQRGVARPQGAYPDIGAFEATPDFSLSPMAALVAEAGGTTSASVQVNSIVGFSAPVSLTFSSPPPGFSASFNPNPVTPPGYGAAASSLTLGIGPSVTPGPYRLTLTGTSGTLSHSIPLNVTVDATPDSITDVIGADQALGCIDNSGIVNALTNKLAAAQAAIAAGKAQEAINTLKALLNQLNAQAGKHISTTCTDGNGNQFDPVQTLITDVKALLASLGVTLKADPIIGSAVASNGTAISGATINVLNPARKVVATAATDVTGFYYFAATGGLSIGSSYTMKVVVPRGYKTSTPAAQSFVWQATTIQASNFILK